MIAATLRLFRPRASSPRPGTMRGETGASCRSVARVVSCRRRLLRSISAWPRGGFRYCRRGGQASSDST
jgi:hypothetical protein